MTGMADTIINSNLGSVQDSFEWLRDKVFQPWIDYAEQGGEKEKAKPMRKAIESLDNFSDFDFSLPGHLLLLIVSKAKCRALQIITSDAAEILRQDELILKEFVQFQQQKIENASKGGKGKSKKWGEFRAFVYGCWKDWQSAPDNYPSTAEFARDMLDKKAQNVSIRDPKTIERWCREWKKELQKTG